MILPMPAEQQAIYDEHHCRGCRLGLDPADTYRITDMHGVWCERCFTEEMDRDAEESHWCDCGGGRFCPGPHKWGAA